jgi:hypothetical protein
MTMNIHENYPASQMAADAREYIRTVLAEGGSLADAIAAHRYATEDTNLTPVYLVTPKTSDTMNPNHG